MKRILSVTGLLVLASCASTPVPDSTIAHARSAVQAAGADPAVSRYARGELEVAQDAFANAERGARQSLAPQVIEHWAYLAEKRALIARETARLRVAEEGIKTAEAERAQIARVPAPAIAPATRSGAADASSVTGGAALVLGDDSFVADGFTLKPDAEAGIERVAHLLQEDPSRVARIDGHSDDMGSRSRSLEFSGRRAEAVRGALVAHGIDAHRVAVWALGDSFPVASNETELGRHRNRRVDVYVLREGEAPPSPP